MQSLDLGLIGNCAISALIDRKANIVWCCLPRFDKDPVFHSLLGTPENAPGEGHFSIEMDDLVSTEQRYVPNTAKAAPSRSSTSRRASTGATARSGRR